MARYVSAGARIPRRGEIGLPAQAIERFEASGYIMSGSRHTAMNAVRQRKEAQVLTVEGKRMATIEAIQERMRKEEDVIKGLKGLINERLMKKSEEHDSESNQ